MSNNDHKKTDDQGGINPVAAAAVVGAVVGAGVGIAGTIAMQNPENREKVKDALGSVKDHATEYVGNLQSQAEDKKEEIAEKVEETAKKVEEKASK